MAKKTITEANETRFTKAALKASKRYKDQIDVLEAILDDSSEYTIEETEAAIDKFLNKEVF